MDTGFRIDAKTTTTHCLSATLPIVDWWQGTFASAKLFLVVKEVALSFPASTKEPIRPPKGMAYRHAFKLADGITICFNNRYGHDTCAIIISGIGRPTQHLRLISRLHDLGVKATRIDVAFDDFDHHLSREKIEEAITGRQVVSHFRSAKLLQEIKLHASGSSGSPATGWGALFGSRQSDACVRMYDRGDNLRVELELKGDEAEEFGDDLADIVTHHEFLAFSDEGYVVQTCDLVSPSAVDAFKRLALQTLKAKLSFRDRSATSNVSRAPTLAWWEEFLEYFDPELEKTIPQAHRKTREEMDECFDKWVASDYDPALFVPPYHPIEWEEMNAAEVRRNETFGEVSSLLTELWESHKHIFAAPNSYVAPDIVNESQRSHLILCASNETPSFVRSLTPPGLTLLLPPLAVHDGDSCSSTSEPEDAFDRWARSGYLPEYFVAPYNPPEWLNPANAETGQDSALMEVDTPVTEASQESSPANADNLTVTARPGHLQLVKSHGTQKSACPARRPPIEFDMRRLRNVMGSLSGWLDFSIGFSLEEKSRHLGDGSWRTGSNLSIRSGIANLIAANCK